MSLTEFGARSAEIDTLLSTCASIVRTDPNQAYGMASQALEMSVACGYRAGEAEALFRSASALRLVGKKSEAARSIEAAELLFRKLNDAAGLLRCKNHRASLYRDMGEIANAIVLFTEVVAEAREMDKPLVGFSALAGLVSSYEMVGDKVAILEHAEEAATLANKIGRDDTIGVGLCMVASAYQEFELWEDSIAAYARSIDYLTRAGDNNSLANALANRAYSYWKSGDNVQAVGSYEETLAFSLEKNEIRMQIAALACLGYLAARNAEADKARELTERALELVRPTDFRQELVQTLEKAGETYALLGDDERALLLFNEALANSTGFDSVRLTICEHLSRVHARRGEFEPALAFEHERSQLQSTMGRLERERGRSLLDVRRKLAQSQEERSRLLQEKAELVRRASERDQELTRLALNLADRYELLQTIRDQLLSADGNKRAIVRAIDRHIEETDGWRTFELQFQSAYGEFSSRLLATCPDLTQSEMRICSLLKLGLSSKQIADILRASPRTIEWHRTAIRKKLGLSTNDNLSTFLASLS